MRSILPSVVSPAVALIVYASANIASGKVSLPAAISDNMVLQRDLPVPIWGMADPSETVAVTFNGQSRDTKAAPDGKWRVDLDPMSAGGPYSLEVQASNTLKVDNILVGEVWFCSGQSNMYFPLVGATSGTADVAAAKDTELRLFSTKRTATDEPQFTVDGSWRSSAPETAADFSAVAYYFGQNLRSKLGVPVGLIHASWGGTPAESWVPRTLLESDADYKPVLERWAKSSAEYPAAKKAYEADLPKLTEEYNKALEAAKASGGPKPKKPREPLGAPGSREVPGGAYNAMVLPHVPFAIRGVIWYQGEANASRANQYRELFPSLIKSWRAAWQKEELPFLYVQLPNMLRESDLYRSGWCELREAQLMTLSLPHTAMAVTIDVGDPNDLHPKNKKPVGERLAIAALGTVYNQPNESMGPIYESNRVEGKAIRVSFTHAKSGLAAKDGELREFTICGADKKFVPAKAIIDGPTVLISSDSVAVPVAARYAWSDAPACNLYNKDGLPASPFRTDDWPGLTVGKK